MPNLNPVLAVIFRLLLAALTLGAFGTVAAAQNVTFASVSGNDANDCLTTASACRSLSRAVATAGIGGDVRILDSGFYGTATITKSITISGDDVVLSRSQIRVNSSTAVVSLRGLHLNGNGTIANGIRIDAAATVHIANCEVERYFGEGIYMLSTGHAKVLISDTSVHETSIGIKIVNGYGALRIENSRINNNVNDGINTRNVPVSIVDSSVTYNGSDGFDLYGGDVEISNSHFEANGRDGISNQFGSGSITNSVLSNNNRHGIYVTAASFNITSSIFESNTDSGIYLIGSVDLKASAVTRHSQGDVVVGGGDLLMERSRVDVVMMSPGAEAKTTGDNFIYHVIGGTLTPQPRQ